MSFNKLISHIIVSGLFFISSHASALQMRGELQPQRYTYYLTNDYAQKLFQLRQQPGNAKYPGSKLSLSMPPYQNGVTNKPQPKAMTCISSIWYNDLSKQKQLNIGCIDDAGVEYAAYTEWPHRSIATLVCQVGETGCEAFLVMDSEKWNGPK